MPTPKERKNACSLFLYALSTCGMCTRVKNLLAELEVEFEYIDVDLLEGGKKDEAKKEMRKWDPRGPFPMLIINNSQCVVGDEPELIKKALGK